MVSKEKIKITPVDNKNYLVNNFVNSLETKKLGDLSYFKDFIKHVRDYTKELDISESEILELRNKGTLLSHQMDDFFRSKERDQNLKFILQYLMNFLKRIPLEKDIENEPVNPFKQFKEFTVSIINLLMEDDVKQAIFRIQRESMNKKNDEIWCDKKMIDRSYAEMMDLIKDLDTATLSNYTKLFIALNKLCIFWFIVRSKNLIKVRISDVYIFQLTSMLNKKK